MDLIWLFANKYKNPYKLLVLVVVVRVRVLEDKGLQLFQNNHHHAGARPNFAAKWYEFDPTYPIILFLDKIKVIKLVRVKK